VAIAQREHGLSRRRACGLIGISRSVVEREPRRAPDPEERLRERLRALPRRGASSRPGGRVDYNLDRPHTSLWMATPAAFAAARPFAKRRLAPVLELDGGSPPEPVAALPPPMLSDAHGFP
jgi:hypothetical protein